MFCLEFLGKVTNLKIPGRGVFRKQREVKGVEGGWNIWNLLGVYWKKIVWRFQGSIAD